MNKQMLSFKGSGKCCLSTFAQMLILMILLLFFVIDFKEVYAKEPCIGDEIQIEKVGKTNIYYQKAAPTCNQGLSENTVPPGTKFKVQATEYVKCGMMPPVLYLLVIHQKKQGWISVFNTTDAPTFGGRLPNGYWIYKNQGF
jgi:hypothetical protein